MQKEIEDYVPGDTVDSSLVSYLRQTRNTSRKNKVNLDRYHKEKAKAKRLEDEIKELKKDERKYIKKIRDLENLNMKLFNRPDREKKLKRKIEYMHVFYQKLIEEGKDFEKFNERKDM